MTTHSTVYESLAGRAIIAGFDGTILPDSIERRLRTGALGGIILFKRNIEDVSQTHALLDAARRASPQPILTSVDQEGGRVVRLRAPLTVLPPARAFGALDDVAVTTEAGALVGAELSAVGFNLDFAPVLDVDTNPNSPVIGDRSFSGNPEMVSRHGQAFAAGLWKSGIIPVAKHFPGHGDATVDSHRALPTVAHDVNRLRAVEELPFHRWARSNVGPVMSAHVVYPALDPNYPATLSAAIIGTTLRQHFGFEGVVFSDDLEMGALDAFGDTGEVAVRAITAGIDSLLICRSEAKRDAAIHRLAAEAATNPPFLGQLKAAVARCDALPRKAPVKPLRWLGSADHLDRQTALLAALNKA